MLRFDTPATRAFWTEACAATGIDPATDHHAGTFSEPDGSEGKEAFIDSLSEMARAGDKRGTAHMALHFSHEKIAMRKPGDCWIVTTCAGDPLCLVRITDVAIVPFNEVGAAFAASEGEGDLSVAFWREAHIHYFKRQCKAWNVEWRDDCAVVCESFERVYLP
jgi:uncharacterized protein YhfF